MVRSSGFHMKQHSDKYTVGTAAVSIATVPALQQLSPPRILAPFRRLYHIDHSLRQFLVAISAGSLFILSKHSYTQTRPAFVAELFRYSGILTGLNYTFTAYILDRVARPLVMPLIIDEDDDETGDNLDRWAFWNSLRADCTLGLGAVLSICAVLEFDVIKMLSRNIQWITRSLFGSFFSI
jgi:hypothetical protein